MMRHRLVILGLLGALCACGTAEPNLVKLRSNDSGPEEFSIDVMKPLQEPQDYAALPTPGGGANRADLTPKNDAIAVLGGSVGASSPAESVLLSYAGRFGVDPNIRTLLAQEDAKKRRTAAVIRQFQILERDKYGKHYSSFALNADAEALYWAKRGVPVPRPRAVE